MRARVPCARGVPVGGPLAATRPRARALCRATRREQLLGGAALLASGLVLPRGADAAPGAPAGAAPAAGGAYAFSLPQVRCAPGAGVPLRGAPARARPLRRPWGPAGAPPAPAVGGGT
jgi:hypothetical protein